MKNFKQYINEAKKLDFSLQDAYDFNIKDLQQKLFFPVAEMIVAKVGSKDTQDIIDYFVKKYKLPKIIIDNKIDGGWASAGAAALMSDGSYRVSFKDDVYHRNWQEKVILIMHEIEHIKDYVENYITTVHSPFPKNLDDNKPLLPQMIPGHHKNFIHFNIDYPYYILSGKIKI